MVLPQEPEVLSVEEVLTALAMIRGFMAVGGRADQSRAARVILKDYVSVSKLSLISSYLERLIQV